MTPFETRALTRIAGRRVEFHRSCDSTNRLARERGVLGTIVVADHQTAGRGRLGRRWESAPGDNLLMSLVLRQPLPVARMGRCPLVWGAVLAEALGAFVKWPNDLIDDRDRKLGGMRIEMISPDVLVLGVGINVNQIAFSEGLSATSLRELRGERQDRLDWFGRLVRALDAADPAAPAALDSWRARSRTLGRLVRIGEVKGVATGVREDGALLVGGEVVLAGDVELISA